MNELLRTSAGARVARAGHGASGEHDPPWGDSLPPYDGFNLAGHVGDDPARVAGNRRQPATVLGLSTEPAWLEQVHGIHAVAAETVSAPVVADAAWTREPGRPLRGDDRRLPAGTAVRPAGTVVAAAHAGWRGLGWGDRGDRGAMEVPPTELLAWLGPAIGPDAFEVGKKYARPSWRWTRATPPVSDPRRPGAGWRTSTNWHGGNCVVWASRRFMAENSATFSEPERFSHRRENRTGRMASLIWLVSQY